MISVVKEVYPKSSYPGPSGEVYTYDIVMENGDAGEYGSLSDNQNKFIVGQEIEYNFIGGKYPKIKPVYQQGGNRQQGQRPQGGGQQKKEWKQEPFEEKAIGFAMSYAKDLVVAGKVEFSEIGKTARRIYAAMLDMNSKKAEAPPPRKTTTQQEPQPGERGYNSAAGSQTESDDLPF